MRGYVEATMLAATNWFAKSKIARSFNTVVIVSHGRNRRALMKIETDI
jgi:hypothetical protein